MDVPIDLKRFKKVNLSKFHNSLVIFPLINAIIFYCNNTYIKIKVEVLSV